MRKHRLLGVVIAAFVGVGAFTHSSDTSHRTSGTHRAGLQLIAAALPAHHRRATVPGNSQPGNSQPGNSNDATVASAGVASAPVDVAVASSTIVHSAVAADVTSVSTDALLSLETNHSGTTLPFPFEAAQLVTDYRVAAQEEQAEVSAYLTSVAKERAALRAYLVAVAPRPTTVRRPTTRAAVARPAPRDPWPALRQCESGGNYADNTGNGYYGAYQFTLGTWTSLGFRGLPSQAPAAQQDQAAQELQARRGWGQWPSCARRLGLL